MPDDADYDLDDLRAALAGAGCIEAEEQLPDGRYHIVVRGLERVRLVEELDNGKPYREFRGEVLEDVYPPAGSAALVRQRQALEACVLRLAEVLPPESGAPQLAELATRTESPSQLADLVAAEVVSVILMLSRGRTPSA